MYKISNGLVIIWNENESRKQPASFQVNIKEKNTPDLENISWNKQSKISWNYQNQTNWRNLHEKFW